MPSDNKKPSSNEPARPRSRRLVFITSPSKMASAVTINSQAWSLLERCQVPNFEYIKLQAIERHIQSKLHVDPIFRYHKSKKLNQQSSAGRQSQIDEPEALSAIAYGRKTDKT